MRDVAPATNLSSLCMVQGYFWRTNFAPASWLTDDHATTNDDAERGTPQSSKMPPWLEGAALNKLWAERHGFTYLFYIFAGPSHRAACLHHAKSSPIISNWVLERIGSNASPQRHERPTRSATPST